MPVDLRLFPFAPKIEIGKYTPLLQRSHHLHNGVRDMVCGFQKLVPPACCVRQYNEEEHGRFPAPIVPGREGDVDYMRSKLLRRAVNRRLELRLFRERRWDVQATLLRFLTLLG